MGKDLPLNATLANLPDMSGVLDDWLQALTFVKITKSVVNFKNVETEVQVSAQGVWQPMGARTLAYKPEGQRGWRWYQMWTKTDVGLKPDDIVLFKGAAYRVKADTDWSQHGYFAYELVEDWQVPP